MSDDKSLTVDESDLKEGKGSLEHVETKTQAADMKSVLACGSCDYTQDVPAEWEEKDNPEFPDCPNGHGKLAIKIVPA